ncbi:MAG: hypothetical protein QOE62_4157 [Actinomycetota bacterium]|nr:hypothetical protein [Actinomycetota bacterium]
MNRRSGPGRATETGANADQCRLMGCVTIGVAFSSEELGRLTTGWVTDHFHPWIDAQGNPPLVWSVLGGDAEATRTRPNGSASGPE